MEVGSKRFLDDMANVRAVTNSEHFVGDRNLSIGGDLLWKVTKSLESPNVFNLQCTDSEGTKAEVTYLSKNEFRAEILFSVSKFPDRSTNYTWRSWCNGEVDYLPNEQSNRSVSVSVLYHVTDKEYEVVSSGMSVMGMAKDGVLERVDSKNGLKTPAIFHRYSGLTRGMLDEVQHRIPAYIEEIANGDEFLQEWLKYWGTGE